MSFFAGDLKAQTPPSKITKNNSQGIIFVMLSCQRVLVSPAVSRVKLAKFSAKLVANFRRSVEGDFRASFAGEKIVRSVLHQNSTANFTIKLHDEVLGCLRSEMVAANLVAAINPPIDDMDPIRKFSIDPGDCRPRFCGRHFRDF